MYSNTMLAVADFSMLYEVKRNAKILIVVYFYILFSIITILQHFFPRENENLSEVLQTGYYKGIALRQRGMQRGSSPSNNYMEEILSGAVNAMEQRFKLNQDDKSLIDCTKNPEFKSMAS